MRKLPRNADGSLQRRTDPAYAPTVEIFDNMPHKTIHDKVQLLKPSVLAGGQQAWGDAAAGLADAVSQAHTEIRAAIADGWRGSGAHRAAEAVRSFEETGQELADVLAVVSQRLGRAGDAAEALRSAVSAPPATALDLGAALLDPTQATTNASDQKTAEHSRQDVVRAMNDIYTDVFIPTGTDVPAFPDQQTGDQQAAPSGTPAAKLVGPGLDTETPLAQQVPLGTGAAGSQPAAATTTEERITTEQPATETEEPAVVTPASSPVVPDVGAPSTPALSPVTMAAGTESALSTTPAATQVPSTPAAATPSTPMTTAASTPQVTVPTIPGTAGTATADEQRKRDEQRRATQHSGSDAVTGLGAGAMGGLMGGAIAAGDTPRPGSSVAANAAVARTAQYDDEEDDDFLFDDLPTYLEPSDNGGELIGAIDPTTPPVLGEWTELE
ncbi:hypothetical protein [Nocardia sp. NPDC049149]|uniref:PPE domain-containing protein n=1 Tax=Nocardia sp. NPDC049149 TaxID=3364315 RepID=UPI00371D5CB4